MEMIREYLIINFLFRQERGRKDGTISFYDEYSPEIVRKEIYKMFGKEPR